ncbi:MAG: adenylyltransferase/cytidyltransferase family protein [Candidatus Uhrbacteria bacterium]
MKKNLEKNKISIDSRLNFGGKVILNHKKLQEIVEHCKGLGLRIVLTQGSWDLIHIGHARYMCEAKKHGDLLIVGVDSDEKIRKRKGPDRPIVPQEERMEMVGHLRYVDLVTIKESKDPKWNLIKMIRPDVLIATKRMEYTRKDVKELQKFCGQVKLLESQATTSTSAKIRLLQINTAHKLEKSLTPKILETIENVLRSVK